VKFFMPHTKNEADAEGVYDSIKAFARQTLGWTPSDRRIFRIDYVHEGKRYYAEVGQQEKRRSCAGVCATATASSRGSRTHYCKEV